MQMENNKNTQRNNKTSENILNDLQSDKNASKGQGEIKKFDNLFPNHKAQEDTDEISSTNDV